MTLPAIPAVPNSNRYQLYSPVVLTTDFAIPFPVFGDGTDVRVFLNGVETSAFSVLSSSGTFSLVPRPVTDAYVRLNTGVSSGTVEIESDWNPRRTTQATTALSTRDFNLSFSGLVASLRDQWQRLRRAVKAPPGENSDLTLPSVANRANKVLTFDGSGLPSVSSFGAAGVIATLAQMLAGTEASAYVTPARFKDGLQQASFFQPSGTGAGTRTFPSKAEDIVNLVDYGVTGDGTDEAAKVQNAINAAAGKFLLCPANMNVSVSTITGVSGTTWFCPSAGTFSFKKYAADTSDLASFVSKTHVKVFGISFDGNELHCASATATGTNGTNTITVSGVSGTIAVGQVCSGTNISLKAVVSAYNSGTGVVTLMYDSDGNGSLDANANNTGAVSGTVYFDNGHSLLGIASGNRISVEWCRFRKFTRIGIGINATTHFYVLDNFIQKTAASQYSNQAIVVTNSSGTSQYGWVERNYCNNSGIINIGHNVHYCFNVITGWTYGAGISTSTNLLSNHCVLKGNYCSSGTGLDGDGFDLKGIESWGWYARIEGNMCIANSGPGILVGGMYSNVSNNTCMGNCTYGNTNIGGINVVYSSSTNNGGYSTFVGNKCLDVLGAGGTQWYGIVADYRCDWLTFGVNDIENNKTGRFRCTDGGAGTQKNNTWTFWSRNVWHVESGLDLPNLASGASTLFAVTVSYAELGDQVSVACDIAAAGLQITAYVHAANTVYVNASNLTGGAVNLAAATFRFMVTKAPY